jgi:nucleotide-binding universal stress UspA family protein
MPTNEPRRGIADMHVIVDLRGKRNATVLAADVAQRVGAHLTGLTLAFEPLIPAYPMAAPIPTDYIVAARDTALNGSQAAAAAFEAIARPRGLVFKTRAIESIAGEGFAEVVEACRLSDLVVVSQSNPDDPEPLRGQLVEALLFDAAAPTLLVPYVGVDTLKTDKAIVAWDGSAQASRALRAALPLLAGTRQVIVAMVTEADKWAGGVPGADVASHLARHGLSVDVKRLDNPMRDVAATLLGFVADENADWIVMGAYGHSRVRQLFLGGVTRALLGSATVPVLMAH